MTKTNPTNSKPLGLAIVGCGQIVTHHLEAIIQQLPASTFCLRALCDPSAERRLVIEELHQKLVVGDDKQQQDTTAPTTIQHFDSLDALIANQQQVHIDVIFIAVPHDLHETLALQALEQTGCVVVMEKPLAPTADACRRLEDASLHQKGRLVVAEQSPYWPAVVRVQELIQAKAIGTVVTAAAYYYESMRDNITSGSLDQDGCGLGWRGSLARAGGGIALDGGLHWIRPLREWCGGRVTRVVGVTRANLQPALQMEGESLGHALLEMDTTAPTESTITNPLQQPKDSGPLVCTYSCHMLATAPMAHDTCPYFRITGTDGELVVAGNGLAKEQPGAGGVRLYNQDHPDGKDMLDPTAVGGFFLGFGGLWQEIARILSQQDAAAAHETVVRAADDVRAVLALYKSARTRQWESTSNLEASSSESKS